MPSHPQDQQALWPPASCRASCLLRADRRSPNPSCPPRFPGDDIPIVRGSALAALKGDNPKIGKDAIMKLMEAVDSYFVDPTRPLDRPFAMPIEDVFSIQARCVRCCDGKLSMLCHRGFTRPLQNLSQRLTLRTILHRISSAAHAMGALLRKLLRWQELIAVLGVCAGARHSGDRAHRVGHREGGR